jgi:hypothetical protein
MKHFFHQLKLGRPCQIGEFRITWVPVGHLSSKQGFWLSQECTGLTLCQHGRCTAANFTALLSQLDSIPLLSDTDYRRNHPSF